MTEQELTQARADLAQLDIEQLRCGVMVQLLHIEALTKECDAYQQAADTQAMQHKVGPVAWLVYVAEVQNQYVVDDIDDPQLVDDCTNHNAEVTPLYAHPATLEQAQVVEPCKGHNCGSISPKLHSAECFDEHEALAGCQRPFGYFHFVFDSDNGDYWRETDDASEMPLYAHPAPPVGEHVPEADFGNIERAVLIAGIKHELAEFSHNEALKTLLLDAVEMLQDGSQATPPAGERAELIHALRGRHLKYDTREVMLKAADMLEADSKAQQVAVPMTDQQIAGIAQQTQSAEPGNDGYILPFTFARAIEAHHGITKPVTKTDWSAA